MKCVAIGDSALTCLPEDGSPHAVAGLAERLRNSRLPGVVDVLAAFDSVTILYDATAFVRQDAIDVLSRWVQTTADTASVDRTIEPTRTIDIPVLYGGEDGLDLAELSAIVGLSVQELIDLHASKSYTVTAVGFLPGFAYLSGLDDRLHVPRRPTPRLRVPAGSVAVGGPYTGVYPIESPGGWHLIGRTTEVLFDPARPAAVPFRVGDLVRFVPQTPPPARPTRRRR